MEENTRAVDGIPSADGGLAHEVLRDVDMIVDDLAGSRRSAGQDVLAPMDQQFEREGVEDAVCRGHSDLGNNVTCSSSNGKSGRNGGVSGDFDDCPIDRVECWGLF